ncbi:MAG: hypothetical protein J6W35_02655 [Eubacterium sp.]|nr:hypothetical protein [Eubacterium sp.]
MKRIIALVLSLALTISGLYLVPVKAADKTLTLGTKYSGKLSSYGSDTYTFTMTSSSNVQVLVGSDNEQLWTLRSTDYSVSFSTQTAPSNVGCYLPKGKTYELTIKYSGNYTLQVNKISGDKITSKGKKVVIKSADSKSIGFTFSGIADYARDNLKIKSSVPKVATAAFSVNGNNSGTVTIYPKYIGKTIISLSMVGGNTIKYTVHCTNGHWYVAKGSKAKAPKPKGVKKIKWSSSKKKRIKIKKKSGRIKAKKGGRCTLIAKAGGFKYKIRVYVTDFKKLAKRTYREIKDVVNNPDKLKLYNIYKGYYKMNGHKVPVVYFDYASTNSYGAYVRNKIMAAYDDVGTWRCWYVSNANNIIKKKRIKAKTVKKK